MAAVAVAVAAVKLHSIQSIVVEEEEEVKAVKV